MRVPLASGAYREIAPGTPARVCENLYLEKVDTDPKRPLKLVKRPGSVALPDWTGGTIRGCDQADGFAGGKLLFVIGNALKTYDPDTGTVATITGTVIGSDRVQFAFTETQCGILAGGTIHVASASAVRAATDGMLDTAGLAIGSTNTNVASAAFDYSIAGVTFSKGAVAAGTAPGNDVIPQGTFGAVAFDIGTNGTIDVIEATGNATGYASAALAAAGLPAVANDHVRLGYVTASKSDSAFTFGTTALDAANTTVAYTSTATNTAHADLLAAHSQTVFTSITAIGQRLIATFGSRFCYSEVLDIGNTTALSYYTAESAPDGLTAAFTIGAARLRLFGTKTFEDWYETGDSDNPFRRGSGQVEKTGCLLRDAIRELDNTPYWIDAQCSVRRSSAGPTAEIVSTPAIAKAIREEAPANIIAWGYETDGHAFYGVRLSTGTYVFDANMGEWHTRITNLTDTWRYAYVISANRTHYVADYFGGVGFAEMAGAYESEHMADAATMGTEIVWRVTGFLPISEGIEDVESIRLEVAPGQGLPTGQGSNPQVQMRKWRRKDWTAWRSRTSGAQGRYDVMPVWTLGGLAYPPGLYLEFSGSDPVKTVISGACINEDL